MAIKRICDRRGWSETNWSDLTTQQRIDELAWDYKRETRREKLLDIVSSGFEDGKIPVMALAAYVQLIMDS